MDVPEPTNKSFNRPLTMAELLPGLSGILTKDSILTLTAKKQKQSRITTANPHTAEKIFKPLTFAEMRANLLIALKEKSPRRFAQSATTSKKRNWNSSVKVENKTISHTGGGQMKHNSVRKVLNFQAKPKPVPNTRMTMMTETPKFPRPELRPKKAVQPQAILKRNTMRISGICKIPETPELTAKPVNGRFTIANKENFPKPNPIINNKTVFSVPKPINHKRLIPVIPDTPMNESWKSSCDASFIQKEKEIEGIESKVQALTEEQTLEDIAEVSPPVSTPFKEYRNVNEYFNNSNSLNSSEVYHDNTIMCFDNASNVEPVKREESVIVSLCDLLNKASVTQPEKTSTTLEDLLKGEKSTENYIRMIDQGIVTLNNIKQSELKKLRYVRKLIAENKIGRTKSESDKDKTLVSKETTTPEIIVNTNESENVIVGKPCSVIKSCTKSPTYKIPKKNLCLRKKVFHKSVPDYRTLTPPRESNDKALNVYLKMKEQMNFLNTPVLKKHDSQSSVVPNTPAVTSQNLQLQLDKLYNGS